VLVDVKPHWHWAEAVGHCYQGS